jgi:hypothetical protein
MSEMSLHEDTDSSVQQVISVSTDELERGLQMVMTIRTANSVCIIPSRMHVYESYAVNSDHPEEQRYYTQSSFDRSFTEKMRELVHTDDVEIDIRVCHVILEDSICSGTFSRAQFMNMCMLGPTTREIARHSTLSWDGWPCGTLTGRGTTQGARFNVHMRRDILRNILTSSVIAHLVDHFQYPM